MKCYMTGKPCDYHKTDVNNGKMFIISPFGFPFDSLYKTGGNIQQFLEKEHKKYIKKAHRSDQTMRLGSIMCQGICKEIIENQYLFADVSLSNPNVYYELGLAYALSREMVIVKNTSSSNNYSDIFVNAWKSKNTFVQYMDMDSLQNALAKIRLTQPIKISKQERYCDSPKILILENDDGGIRNLYKSLLSKHQKNFKFDEDLLNILTESERGSFKADIWRTWDITTLPINNKTTLSSIVQNVAQCKICIVDTTSYVRQTESITNPYMFFCLGIAHGFEKEVIPLTNTLHSHSSSTPFDVKGLWHIFFSKEEELASGFGTIIPRISVEFHKELFNEPYRKIWNGFLADKQTLSVIYCGRPINGENDPNYKNRGPRTNIDSWDTKAVSEVSFYLAQKYPTALIKPASPKTKLRNINKVQIEEIKKQLSKASTNFVIVGSPDVNDYAEIVLAELFGVEPFNSRINSTNKGGFIFHKNNIKIPLRSSFYRKDLNNKVAYLGDDAWCNNKTTYGVLTIARNPFNKEGTKVMVLSGFTGLATCGLMELLIESEPENNIDISFKKKLRKILEEDLSSKFDPKLSKPFSAIIGFIYDTTGNDPKMGDNRCLKNAHVVEVFSS